MGKKQTGRGKHLYLFFACFLIVPVFLSGCAHYYEELVTRPDFAQAGNLAGQGNYKEAVDSYEQIIDRHSRIGDTALFQMGMIYASARNPAKDYYKALECFQKLVHNYPESQHRQDSDVLISLLGEIAGRDKKANALYKQIEKLEQQLEQMKEIDMNWKQKKKALP